MKTVYCFISLITITFGSSLLGAYGSKVGDAQSEINSLAIVEGQNEVSKLATNAFVLEPISYLLGGGFLLLAVLIVCQRRVGRNGKTVAMA